MTIEIILREAWWVEFINHQSIKNLTFGTLQSLECLRQYKDIDF